MAFSSDKPSLHNIEFYQYHSIATVTASGSVVDQWIPEALRTYKKQHDGDELLVGLVIECCLPTEPGAYQKVAIVQISVGESCLIFQLHHADHIPQSLVNFLRNDKITFVGNHVKRDANKLEKDFGLHVAKTRDVGRWAARILSNRDYEKMGLQKLVMEFFHRLLEKPKEITLSDWTVKELTFRQIKYACLNAYLSFELAHFLSKRSPPKEKCEDREYMISDKSSVHNIKFYQYHSTATVTASGSVVDQWIPKALRTYKEQHDGDELLVGLVTECCLPAEPGAYQKVAIVQISVGESCLIFQLHHADHIPQSLVNFLRNDKITFVGNYVNCDAKKLEKDFGLHVAKTRDVGRWAARILSNRDYEKMGLQKLVMEFFHRLLEKPKEITLSDWTVRELTCRQIKYACLNAYLSFELAHFLSKLSSSKKKCEYREYMISPMKIIDRPVKEEAMDIDKPIKEEAVEIIDKPIKEEATEIINKPIKKEATEIIDKPIKEEAMKFFDDY